VSSSVNLFPPSPTGAKWTHHHSDSWQRLKIGVWPHSPPLYSVNSQCNEQWNTFPPLLELYFFRILRGISILLSPAWDMVACQIGESDTLWWKPSSAVSMRLSNTHVPSKQQYRLHHHFEKDARHPWGGPIPSQYTREIQAQLFQLCSDSCELLAQILVNFRQSS
jgi:hypothetical protein